VRAAWLIWLGCALTGVGGCLTVRPTSFPPVPQRTEHLSSGVCLHVFDVNGDAKPDYAEEIDATGWVWALRYDDSGVGAWEETITRGASPPTRQLVLILDSVPFEMVCEARRQGRLALFHAPSRIIPPFPAMTDMSLNELLGTSPSPGLESDRYDGEKLHDGWSGYPKADNSPWLTEVDWYLPYRRHSRAYLNPARGFLAELADIERALADDGSLLAYAVGPSALGFIEGREGHLFVLAEIDRFCRMLVHRFRDDIAITLLSDHGHCLAESRMVPLRRILTRLGYRVSKHLRQPGDVVVAGFGLISCAALFTDSPERLAGDVVRAEGVELAMYRAGDEVIVLSRDGRARVTRCAAGWRYSAELGDPLQLGAIISRLHDGGAVDAEGCIDDSALFRATLDHVYPDPLDRCWRAFDGLMAHPPDVVLSLADGWHWGSPFINRHVSVRGTHGSLGRAGSIGFIMSTQGALPEAQRMREVPANLARIGVNLPRAAPATD